MRRGQRYLLFRAAGFAGDSRQLEDGLQLGLEGLLGKAVLGRCGYRFMRNRDTDAGKGTVSAVLAGQEAGVGIIKGSIKGIVTIRAGLSLLSRICGGKTRIDTIRVSGTLRGLLPARKERKER